MKSGRHPDNELSREQRRVMVYITEFVSTNGRFPTVTDFFKSGQTRTAWYSMIMTLRAKGYITLNSQDEYIVTKAIKICPHCKGNGFLQENNQTDTS